MVNQSKQWDHVWFGATIHCMDESRRVLLDGAVATIGGHIEFVGLAAEALSHPACAGAQQHRLHAGQMITPGLIDCHTHLIHAGNRAGEFAARLAGASYAEIAQAGGGIMNTVRATRQAADETLLTLARSRLDTLAKEGVTTVEIKSGYGLECADELRLLALARTLDGYQGMRVVTTFLGLHALPDRFRDRRDAYVDHVVDDILPIVARDGLADAVDAFCEPIAFSPNDVDRLLAAAGEIGLPAHVHSDQLSDYGGTEVAIKHRALSIDHLEHLNPQHAPMIAQTGLIPVLLPGAHYFLQETKNPPVAALRAAGAKMAVATDFNPGTSPCLSILTAMNLACVRFGLTAEEALAGVTINAAQALGIDRETGSIEAGKQANFCIWDATMPIEICYGLGLNPLFSRIVEGKTMS